MINPVWLRSLVSVAELGSFTQSTTRLDLTQAAVRQHLCHLEDRFGSLLIPRALELTPAGHALLDHARTVAEAER